MIKTETQICTLCEESAKVLSRSKKLSVKHIEGDTYEVSYKKDTDLVERLKSITKKELQEFLPMVAVMDGYTFAMTFHPFSDMFDGEMVFTTFYKHIQMSFVIKNGKPVLHDEMIFVRDGDDDEIFFLSEIFKKDLDN